MMFSSNREADGGSRKRWHSGRPRGRKQSIVGEALIRVDPHHKASLFEILACGHYQPGVYNEDGDSCNAQTKKPVTFRICRKCIVGATKGPPGEVVQP